MIRSVLRDSELEPDPAKWGLCTNSLRADGRCPHRLSMNEHNCIGRDCPDPEDA